MNAPSDIEGKLVKSLSKGNITAFNALFNLYSSHLYLFAYGYLKSRPESEELVQEVFLKIWEKREDLKAELSIRSYLFTIAYNIIRRHFRTRNYLTQYFKSKVRDDLDMETIQKIQYDSLQKYVTELVNQLPTRRKEIFIKSRFEGLSIKEVAEELNISHKTVENQLTTALKFLKRNLRFEK